MRYSLLILVVSVGFTVVEVPAIKFNDTVVEMDTIYSNRSYTGVFKFKNTGDEPLIITRVNAAAGNVTTSFTNSPIAVGDSGEVKFRMSTYQRYGRFNSAITIIANTKPERYTVLIKGYIKNEDRK